MGLGFVHRYFAGPAFSLATQITSRRVVLAKRSVHQLPNQGPMSLSLTLQQSC